jgi:LysR family hydrogen peroxide-inducible transcriptional activator
MDVCGWEHRPQPQEVGYIQAYSLEKLLQLVGAGFGSTLVPALAPHGPWMTDSGIIARKLNLPDAYRRISLAFRRSFPRRQALEVFADIIQGNLTSATVKKIETR